MSLIFAHFAPVFDKIEAEMFEIVLPGSGHQYIFPDFSLMAELLKRGVALEVMNPCTACRTCSVLVNDQRPVALIQIRE